jgi:RHS repeat-associated protein
VINQTYVYDSFGNTSSTTGTFVQPFRYAGREFDTETGLMYYRARYYDAKDGRFLSEDLLQFNAGINFYEYSYNNPVNFKDPSGLQPAPAYIPPPPAGGLTLIQGGGAAGGAGAGVVAATVGLIALDAGLLAYDVYQGYRLAQAYGYFLPKPSTKPDTAAQECKRNSKRDCDELYRTDIAFCNSLVTPGERAACRAQAMERYANCLAGRQIPPLPWRRPN